jgi:cytochrome c oxidase subunit II
VPSENPGRPRSTRSRAKRVGLAAVGAVGLALLAGCSAETERQIRGLAMPEPATEQAPAIYDLWRWAWLAAILVGIIVWGLIGYVVVRYRRRHEDEVPVQTRYNLPLEIFYTVAPIMMVVVFFYWTLTVQNEVLDEQDPDVELEVVGQQWSWTFNYPYTSDEGDEGYVYYSGTASEIPTLVLPEGERVQFNLHSPDVIHGFWVPGFLMKMDVIPGRTNNFQVVPNQEGFFKGKCTEFCGVSHSRMLFNVDVVSPEEYEAYLDELAGTGQNFSPEPVTGGDDADTVAGLEEEEASQ